MGRQTWEERRTSLALVWGQQTWVDLPISAAILHQLRQSLGIVVIELHVEVGCSKNGELCMVLSTSVGAII